MGHTAGTLRTETWVWVAFMHNKLKCTEFKLNAQQYWYCTQVFVYHKTLLRRSSATILQPSAQHGVADLGQGQRLSEGVLCCLALGYCQQNIWISRAAVLGLCGWSVGGVLSCCDSLPFAIEGIVHGQQHCWSTCSTCRSHIHMNVSTWCFPAGYCSVTG